MNLNLPSQENVKIQVSNSKLIVALLIALRIIALKVNVCIPGSVNCLYMEIMGDHQTLI